VTVPDAFYTPSRDGPLRQGEILTGLKRVVPEPGSALGEQLKADIIEHRFAVILSQDCDLEQDYSARYEIEDNETAQQSAGRERKKLSCVLFCDAIPVDELKGRIADGRVFSFAEKNKNERYQFLREVKAEEDAHGKGIPAGLGLDFKRYFSLAAEDVYAQISILKNRRTVLQTPYAEHLSVRFFEYQLRIALAKEHHIP
jgi:hypothetical protein